MAPMQAPKRGRSGWANSPWQSDQEHGSGRPRRSSNRGGLRVVSELSASSSSTRSPPRFVKPLPERLIGDMAYDTNRSTPNCRVSVVEMISPHHPARRRKTQHAQAAAVPTQMTNRAPLRLAHVLPPTCHALRELKAENFLGLVQLAYARLLSRRLRDEF
jgi:hypothetical protein